MQEKRDYLRIFRKFVLTYVGTFLEPPTSIHSQNDFNMNKITHKIKHILTVLLLSLTVLQFSSCVEDDWWIEDAISYRWHINDIYLRYGQCPYMLGDEFCFYPDGQLEIYGRNHFYESGYWEVDDDRLSIDFNRDGREDMVGRIEEMSDRYMTVDFKDFYDDYESRYLIDFVKSWH